MIYLMGDLQGCCQALERMLQTIDVSPSRDHLFVLGDLVNRGPDSLGVLRRLRGLDNAATCLLGNHDLHLLAVAHGVRKMHRSDTLAPILDAPDREEWLYWLRQQRLAVHAHGWLMVHAGVVPQWDAAQTVVLAGEVEAMLRSPEVGEFLTLMYGNEPARWDDSLQGVDRWRCGFARTCCTRRTIATHPNSQTHDAANQQRHYPCHNPQHQTSVFIFIFVTHVCSAKK